MKHLKKVMAIFILVVSALAITGCGKKIDSRVIGTWEYSEDYINAVYVLKKDGTGSYTITVEENTVEKSVEYYTKDGKLFINFDKDPDTFELEYTIKNKDLVIKDTSGEELVYKKK